MRFGRTLQARQAFDNYAQKFTADGDTRFSQQSTGRQVIKPSFVVDDAMLTDFREHLKNERIRVDDEAFKKESDFIRAMIRFRIDEAVFGTVEAQRHLISADPQAQVAISMFGEAQKLTELAKATGRSKAH